jgi:hypothetical protein
VEISLPQRIMSTAPIFGAYAPLSLPMDASTAVLVKIPIFGNLPTITSDVVGRMMCPPATYPNPQPETRNPKPETRNRKLETYLFSNRPHIALIQPPACTSYTSCTCRAGQHRLGAMPHPGTHAHPRQDLSGRIRHSPGIRHRQEHQYRQDHLAAPHDRRGDARDRNLHRHPGVARGPAMLAARVLHLLYRQPRRVPCGGRACV